MRPIRIASCEECGAHGPMECEFKRHDAALDLWPKYLFCSGKCCARWLVTRNGLPNPGIAAALGHAPGQERG